ncbi:MAG TPA: DUF4148 domain-containing protein [Trinickia sp.]
MNFTIKAIALAIAIAAPAVSYSQSSNEPVARAQIRAQLVELERAGYNPSHADNTAYPNDLQAAEARVAARERTTTSTTGIGGSANFSAQSGHHVPIGGWSALYRHH